MKTYPLAELSEQRRLRELHNSENEFRGVLTGERRPPRADEYYLSGANPEVYRAYNDYAPRNDFHIVRIVEVVKIVKVDYVEVEVQR